MASRLTFDDNLSRVDLACNQCGRSYRVIKAFVRLDGEPHAIAIVALHEHEGVREAWIDVILGTFGEDKTDDHVTFGCRVGPIEGADGPMASLVTGAIPYGDRSMWGHKLTREEALAHPRLPDYWEVVDYLLVKDAEIHSHVYSVAT